MSGRNSFVWALFVLILGILLGWYIGAGEMIWQSLNPGQKIDTNTTAQFAIAIGTIGALIISGIQAAQTIKYYKISNTPRLKFSYSWLEDYRDIIMPG